MAYQKRYRAIVPIPRDEGADDQVAVWLTRESFDRAAAADSLRITAFTDLGELPATNIPPKVDKQLGRPAGEFIWRLFEAVGRRADA